MKQRKEEQPYLSQQWVDSIQNKIQIGDLLLSSPNMTLKEISDLAIQLLSNKKVGKYLELFKSKRMLLSGSSYQ